MPWNMQDYPASLKNLPHLVKKKAIDIANALLEEGYPDDRAIPIATSEAKKWVDDASSEEKKAFKKANNPQKEDSHSTEDQYTSLLTQDVDVFHEGDEWKVKTKGAKRADRTFPTKIEAVEHGKTVAKHKESTLFVFKKDGSKDKQIKPNKD